MVLVAIGSGLGTVLLIAAANRTDIQTLKNAVWGHERDDDDGIKSKLNSIEEKLEEELEAREDHHDDVTDEILLNRNYNRRSFIALIEELNENDDLSDVNIELDDIEPDWVDSEEHNVIVSLDED